MRGRDHARPRRCRLCAVAHARSGALAPVLAAALRADALPAARLGSLTCSVAPGDPAA
jgi:hypothetical protein